MTKIVITCNSTSYATALQASIAASDNYTVSVDGKNVTIEFNAAVDSFTIAALSGGQVRFDSIEVFANKTTTTPEGDVNTETGDTPNVEQDTENN
jgi:hypothetical protein